MSRMNMLRRLPQNSLETRILRITPTLYSSGRIVGVHLLRQYATTTTVSKSGSEPIQKDIPQEPKKPGSAYNLFYRDFYHRKHLDNPSFKVTDIAQLAGKEWQKLSEEEKKIYEERQKKLASDYKKSHKKWLDSLTSEQIAQENTRRKLASKSGKKRKVLRLIRDPKMPKKPKTPYINYIIEHFQEVGTEKGKERIKELAYDWKNVLTPEDKKPYEEAYQKDKIRYEKEMEAFKNQV